MPTSDTNYEEGSREMHKEDEKIRTELTLDVDGIFQLTVNGTKGKEGGQLWQENSSFWRLSYCCWLPPRMSESTFSSLSGVTHIN